MGEPVTECERSWPSWALVGVCAFVSGGVVGFVLYLLVKDL